MNRHATTNRIVEDEDLAHLPYILELEDLRQLKPRGARQGKDYMALHDRLRYLYGRAQEQRCQDCLKPAQDWSLQSYDAAVLDRITNCWYSPDVTRYVPRCRVCHRRHDLKLRKAAIKVA